MIKISVLALLVICLTCQDVKLLSESGSEYAPLEIVEAADGSSLPMKEPLLATTAQAKTNSIVAGGCDVPTSIPSIPINWDFLWKNPIGGQCKWLKPKGLLYIRPKLWTASYSSSFESDCPRNGAKLTFSATGVAFVYLNGKLVHSWYAPSQVHNVQLTGLSCGANKVKIVVYNYYFPSPCALIYSISQQTANCYTCQNQDAAFYNKKTCQCQCQTSPYICFNPLTTYYGYPKCGCGCTKQLICPSNRFWNNQSCSCDCAHKCCPQGYVQDNSTCQCKRNDVCVKKVCGTGLQWNQEKCDCIPICDFPYPCSANQVWDPISCGCKCPVVARCKQGFTFNQVSCTCKCDRYCIATMSLDPVTCSCVPINFEPEDPVHILPYQPHPVLYPTKPILYPTGPVIPIRRTLQPAVITTRPVLKQCLDSKTCSSLSCPT